MPDMENVLEAESNAVENCVILKAAQRPAEKKKTGIKSELWVIACLILISLAGVYEAVTEIHAPALSLMEYAHSLGYLKGYETAYEAGKGIWYLLGWTGSGMMILMMLYSVRKRVAALGSLGSMRRWLSAHMALGVIGPLLITFHTTFDFHGLIATSYWCMVVTVVFGIIGRYIYVQIPRSINGTELGVLEIEKAIDELDRESGRYMKGEGLSELARTMDGDPPGERGPLSALLYMAVNDLANIVRVRRLEAALKKNPSLKRGERKRVVSLVRAKASLIRRKNLLSTSHRLLKHWHVLHVPLAAVMFIIMFIHVAVYYTFRT